MRTINITELSKEIDKILQQFDTREIDRETAILRLIKLKCMICKNKDSVAISEELVKKEK